LRLWNVLKTSWLENPSRSSARAVLWDERAGGGEVLARHDELLFFGPVLLGGVGGPEALERGGEITQLLVGVAGLAQLVAARVPQRGDAAP